MIGRLAAALAALTLACAPALLASPAQAQAVADPGFCYVDVNNDGLYSVADGDRGLTSSPSVDVLALILNDGVFNTQVSEPGYSAPSAPASLVVPASVVIDTAQPITLRAGRDIRLHGAIRAASLTVRAGGGADLSGWSILRRYDALCYGSAQGSVFAEGLLATVDGAMRISAGRDVRLDFAALAGSDVMGYLPPVSNLQVRAGAALTGEQLFCVFGKAIRTEAHNTSARQAYLSVDASDPSTGIRINAKGDLDITNLAASAGGAFTTSSCGLSNMAGISVAAGSVSILAYGDAYLTGSDLRNASLSAAGQVSVTSKQTLALWDPLQPMAAAIEAAEVDLKASDDLDASQAYIVSNTGYTNMVATCGKLTVDGAAILAANNLLAQGGSDVWARSALVLANGQIKFQSRYGALDASASSIWYLDSMVPGTSISARSSGPLTLDGANWTVPSTITARSNNDNVMANNVTFSATRSSFYAGGRTIYILGASISGAVQFSPWGVTVIGP